MINTMQEKLNQCVESVKKTIHFQPKTALVLGSGLGSYGQEIQVEQTLEYRDIEGFPTSTVPGHQGRFLFGYVGEVPVVAMQGRVHYYEGYSIDDVVLPVRLMGKLGAEKLILTNAAGGVNGSYHPGDFMVLKDHISSFVPSPLIGPNLEELGERFPDMSEVYSRRLRLLVRQIAEEQNIPLQEGVYIQLTGPNYETPAEIRMCRILGADAVGMSTACEAIAAKHMGMEICAISCITNLAAGMSQQPLNHQEVQEIAARVEVRFHHLVTQLIRRME